MNDTQLKMILDAMASMGAQGKEAFVWWLVMDKALPVLGWLVTLAAIVLIARTLISWGRQTTRFDELRTALGHNAYTDNDYLKTTKELARLLYDKRA
jgi:hypothetical protein